MTRELMTGMIICSSILFFTVVTGGIFSANAAAAWLKNRREERESRERISDMRVSESREREREEWMQLLKERDMRVQGLQNELLRATRSEEILRKILRESELQRARMAQGNDASAAE